jgi:DNA-directed RNA polymerase specialized sigma subunit
MLATAYNKHQIYGILKDYHWMVREIGRIDRQLSTTDFAGVAQYGIEATMPTAQGVVGRALENEIIRRETKSKRLYDYIDKVNFMNENISKITDEREKVVLDCLLDGLSLTAVSKHLGFSRQLVTDIRDDIVNKLG